MEKTETGNMLIDFLPLWIYLLGCVLAYVIFRIDHRIVSGKGSLWTKKDRIQAMGLSLFSWGIFVLVCFALALQALMTFEDWVADKVDELKDKPAKW